MSDEAYRQELVDQLGEMAEWFKKQGSNASSLICTRAAIEIAGTTPPPEEATQEIDMLLVKNAARYLWLREMSLGQFEHPICVSQKRVERGMQYIGPLVGEPLDKAIDAAIDALAPQEQR